MSEPLHEVIKGKGRLVSSDTLTEYQVEYEFHVFTEVVETSGLPPVAIKSKSTGWVRSLNGKPLSHGRYRLHAEDGEILRVKKVGLEEWRILAS